MLKSPSFFLRSSSILDRNFPKLKIMLGITKAMIEADNSDEVLGAIFEAAIALFEVEACSLALKDPSGELAYLFSSGPGRADAFRVPAGRGFGGWSVTQGKPVLSNAPASDPRFFGGVDDETGFQTKSLLCAPLLLDKKPIGVIQILNTRRPRGFREEDIQIMELLAEMATAAIKKHEYLQLVQHARTAYWTEDRRRNRLVGIRSHAMEQVLATAKVAAASNATVLLMSESGTGKELTARSIHRWSPRAEGPFVAVNCVALTPELLASELFGHEKGAFTGATSTKVGKFELADSGTVFLDEIGELTLDLQAKLLRVLQEREFQRVGGNRNIRVNVRIIAATNRDLKREVANGRFREDLFYRLNVVAISLPPLRERTEDLPELIEFFLRRYSRDTGRPLLALAPEVETAFRNYLWPGNVRQLQNTIERAVVLTRGPVIKLEVLPPELLGTPLVSDSKEQAAQPAFAGLGSHVPMAEAILLLQREKIERALEETEGNKAQAARILGLQPSNLIRLIKKLKGQLSRI